MSAIARGGIRVGVTMLLLLALGLTLQSYRSVPTVVADAPHASAPSVGPTGSVGSEECVVPIDDEGWYGASCDPGNGRGRPDATWASQ